MIIKLWIIKLYCVYCFVGPSLSVNDNQNVRIRSSVLLPLNVSEWAYPWVEKHFIKFHLYNFLLSILTFLCAFLKHYIMNFWLNTTFFLLFWIWSFRSFSCQNFFIFNHSMGYAVYCVRNQLFFDHNDRWTFWRHQHNLDTNMWSHSFRSKSYTRKKSYMSIFTSKVFFSNFFHSSQLSDGQYTRSGTYAKSSIYYPWQENCNFSVKTKLEKLYYLFWTSFWNKFITMLKNCNTQNARIFMGVEDFSLYSKIADFLSWIYNFINARSGTLPITTLNQNFFRFFSICKEFFLLAYETFKVLRKHCLVESSDLLIFFVVSHKV